MSLVQRKLCKEELHEMCNVLSEAFQSHSNFEYLIENSVRRKILTTILFESMNRVINKYGYIFTVNYDNKNVGYITYMDDSSHTMNLLSIMQSRGLRYMLSFIMRLRLKEMKKYLSYLKSYNQFDHVKNESIHLYMTGILKEYRGKRIMGPSLRDSFSFFKNLGYKSILLETSDESNISLYVYLGFKVIKKIPTKNKLQTIYFFEKDL